MEPHELYRIYESSWRNMERENNLVNQRITWSLTLTSGFLLAETFLLGRVFEIYSKGGDFSPFGKPAFIACAVLSCLAAYVCYRVHAGVSAAFSQIKYLKEDVYGKYRKEFEDNMLLPRPFGGDIPTLHGHSAAEIFPLCMMFVWIGFALSELAAALSG